MPEKTNETMTFSRYGDRYKLISMKGISSISIDDTVVRVGEYVSANDLTLLERTWVTDFSDEDHNSVKRTFTVKS